MATNTYVSNEGGGFQGPASDYWMYGLGDMVPARNQASHELDQTRQGYLANLEAQKAKQMQEEWMAAKGQRDAAGQAEMSGNVLKDLTNQQGIAEAPLRAKKGLQELHDGMSQAKRDKMKQELTFLGEHGEELTDRLSGTNDPAEKNKIWKSFMETYGGDTTGMEQWSPQNEKKIKLVRQHFIDNPDFQRLIASKSYDHAAKMDEIDAQGQWGLQEADVRARSAAETSNNKVVSKISGVLNGRNVQQITYENGRTEIVEAPEGMKSEGQVGTDAAVEGAKAVMSAVEEGLKAAGLKGKTLEMALKNNKTYLEAQKKVSGGGSSVTSNTPETPAKAANKPDNLKIQVEKAGVKYEPTKYEYRVNEKGEVQRRPK